MTNQLTKFFTACFLFGAVFIFSFSVDVSRSCAYTIPNILTTGFEDYDLGNISNHADWSDGFGYPNKQVISTTRPHLGTKSLEIGAEDSDQRAEYLLPSTSGGLTNLSFYFYAAQEVSLVGEAAYINFKGGNDVGLGAISFYQNNDANQSFTLEFNTGLDIDNEVLPNVWHLIECEFLKSGNSFVDYKVRIDSGSWVQEDLANTVQTYISEIHLCADGWGAGRTGFDNLFFDDFGYSETPEVTIEASNDLGNYIPDGATVSKSLTDEIILDSVASHSGGIALHTISYTKDNWTTTYQKACGATAACEVDICDNISCPIADQTTIKYEVYAKANDDSETTSDELDFNTSYWVGFPDTRTGSYIYLLRPDDYLGDNNEPTFIVYPNSAFQVVFFMGHQGYDTFSAIEYTDSTFDTPTTMSAELSSNGLTDLTATYMFEIPISDSASKYFSLHNSDGAGGDPLAFIYFTITGDNTSEIKSGVGGAGDLDYCDTIENSWLRAFCGFIVPSSNFFPTKLEALFVAFDDTFPFVNQIADSFNSGKIVLDSAGTTAPTINASSEWNGVSIQLWDMSLITTYAPTFRGYMSIALWLLFITYIMRRAIYMFKTNE